MKKWVSYRLFLLPPLLFSLFFPSLLHCGIPQGYGFIMGIVRDNLGQPVEGARVESGYSFTLTRSDGFYFMAHMVGTYPFAASSSGYISQQHDNVGISENGFTLLDFSLTPEVLQLGSVYPALGKLGEKLEITLRGKGFDHATRLIMAPDILNARRILGTINTPGWASGLTISGNKAYVADGRAGGLQIIDVSDPSHPHIIGAVDTPGNASAVEVAGTLAYVADDWSGLLVIDVSNPHAPFIIGSADTPGHATGVAISGKTAYVADDSTGLQIIDVTDPTRPRIIGSVDTPKNAMGVAIAGNVAYVVDGMYKGDFHAIDVTDPTRPAIIGTIATPGNAIGVAVSRNTAYVADHWSGLQIIDVNDPSKPVIIGAIDTPGHAIGVDVVGETAFIADSEGGLQIINIAKPTRPQIIGSVDTPDASYGVKTVNDVAYMANGQSGMTVIDVSSPNNPAIIGSISTPDTAYGVTVVDNMAYLADGLSGLVIVDVSDPSQPVITGSVDTPGLIARGVSVVGYRAYVVDGNGLHAIDVGNPYAPRILGSISTPGLSYGVTVAGNIAYVADYWSGLHLIDVSDPTVPKRMGSVSIPGNAIGVAVINTTAYVVGGKSGLHIVNVGDPFRPSLLGTFDTPGNAVGLQAKDNIVYVADGLNGLQIIDANNPAKPALIGSVATPWYAFGVTVVGSTAYVVSNGLHMIDVSNPSQPYIISTVDTADAAWGVTVVDNIAYVVENAGLVIFQTPMEIYSKRVVSKTEMTAVLPSPITSGHYSLIVLNRIQSADLLGAVTFAANPPVSKAIIVAGYGNHSTNWLWNETQLNANIAYKALLWQGYKKENIYYLSAANIDVDGNGQLDDVDGDATLANLSFALKTWTTDTASPADNLVLYMIDHGFHEYFVMKRTDSSYELLSAKVLAGWLNTLQKTLPGRVIFIYDACYSGSFVEPLKVPEGSDFKRIVITSSAHDQKSQYLRDGKVSFSYQFWTSIFEGASLVQAFNEGYKMMAQSQTAWLDANGNGIPNEDEDIISGIIIGRGSKSSSGSSEIDSVSASQILDGATSALLWTTVNQSNTITHVSAVIIPPDYDPEAPDTPLSKPPEIELSHSQENGRYEAVYNGFGLYGEYRITYYAEDEYGNVSPLVTTTIFQTTGPDRYEKDDTPSLANAIVINDDDHQQHTFHVPDDADWLKFYAMQGETYSIEATNLGINNNVVLELYDRDAATLLVQQNSIGDPRANEMITWACTEPGCDGVYFVKLYHKDASTYGKGTEYRLKIERNIGPLFGKIQGYVYDYLTGSPINNAIVSTDYRSVISGKDGRYEMVDEAGLVTLSAVADGYQQDVKSYVEIKENRTTTLNFSLKQGFDIGIIAENFGMACSDGASCGDMDGDGDVDGIDLTWFGVK